MSDGFKQVDRISGKAGNGLRKDDVYLSGLAVVEHPLEFFSLGCLCAGDAVIRIDPNIETLAYAATFLRVGSDGEIGSILLTFRMKSAPFRYYTSL